MSSNFYTREQKRVMRYQGLSKVHYHKNMYSRNHELGYAKPGSPYSEIHIAADVAEDVKRVTLLHEVGHIYFNHVSVNIKEELKEIRALFEKNGMNFKNGIRRFGGPMTFLNYCMDLEVNSKLLTLANVKTMYDNNFKILTQKSLDVPTLDTFRDYYEPLILKLKDQEEKEEQNKKNSRSGSQNSGSQGNPSDDDEDGEGSSSDYDDSEDGNEGNQSSGKGKKSKESKGSSKESTDFSDLLDRAMRDLSSEVDPMDSDLDDEMSEALRDEGYERKDDETPETEKSVNDSVESVEDDENVDAPTTSRNYGNSEDNREIEVVENTDKEIAKFLNGILNTSFDATLNYIKNYNRGIRRNKDGILYSSMDNRIKSKKTKLGVLIDVSGSMETDSIIKACSSLKAVSKALDPQSIGVTWAVFKGQEFSLFDVPESVSVGGGTNMARGLEYLVNEKKCDTVVIYSDFCTDDFDKMITLIKKKGTKVYSIDVATDKIYNGQCVLPYGVTDEMWKAYVKLNKGFLRVA